MAKKTERFLRGPERPQRFPERFSKKPERVPVPANNTERF